MKAGVKILIISVPEVVSLLKILYNSEGYV